MRPVRRVHPQQLGSSACSRTSPDDRASIPLLGQQHLAAEDSQRDPRAVAAATNTETESRPMDRNSNRGTSVVAGRIAVEARRNVAVTGIPVRHGHVGETVHRHVAMQTLHRNRNPAAAREPVATETVEFPSPNRTVVRIDENGGNSWCGIHTPTYVAVSSLGVAQSNGNLQHDHRHSNSHHSESHASTPCLLDRAFDNPQGQSPDAGLPFNSVELHTVCQNGVPQHFGFFSSGNPSQNNNLPFLAQRKTPGRREISARGESIDVSQTRVRTWSD